MIRLRCFRPRRATFAYFDGGEPGGGACPGLVSNGNAEERRRLLLKGINATLEQAERAIEVRGIRSQYIIEALGRLRGKVRAL